MEDANDVIGLSSESSLDSHHTSKGHFLINETTGRGNRSNRATCQKYVVETFGGHYSESDVDDEGYNEGTLLLWLSYATLTCCSLTGSGLHENNLKHHKGKGEMNDDKGNKDDDNDDNGIGNGNGDDNKDDNECYQDNVDSYEVLEHGFILGSEDFHLEYMEGDDIVEDEDVPHDAVLEPTEEHKEEVLDRARGPHVAAIDRRILKKAKVRKKINWAWITVKSVKLEFTQLHLVLQAAYSKIAKNDRPHEMLECVLGNNCQAFLTKTKASNIKLHILSMHPTVHLYFVENLDLNAGIPKLVLQDYFDLMIQVIFVCFVCDVIILYIHFYFAEWKSVSPCTNQGS
jgi:hypothetical protein